MKLSIVIVNYNVKYFIEQCLHSVHKAIKNIESEVFVVDNNSVDGSCAMLREKFSWIHLIENKVNTGFSVANNQAIRLAKGEYILLLNPDTLVEEDTFEKIIQFMDSKPEAGGLGVKMIDGKGEFLPESKRGLPTPWVAFYKIFGLSRIFPKSKTFGYYHLGFLNNNEIHEVEVLSGAFMLLRKEALDKVGLLDESFFMYGEDIDLSYRIILGGYKNYYFPKITIIHYKGESTKKGSINYVLVFYNAMIIFARKHFSKKNARFYSSIIKLAIYFRAALAILKRFFETLFLPVIDLIIIYLGFFFITPFWENYILEGGKYPEIYWLFVVPTYIGIWLASLIFTKAYEKPIRISRILRGIGIGTVRILLAYSLLNEHFRFSRAMILFGSWWAFIMLPLFRLFLKKLNLASFQFDKNERKRILIIGKYEEAQRVINLLEQTDLKYEMVGLVNPTSRRVSNYHLGKINQLGEIIEVNKIDELIFCSQSMSAQRIIKSMLKLSDMKISFKIAPPKSVSIIGSNSINTAGDLYVIDINSVAKKSNIRNKRMLDIAVAFIFLMFLPFCALKAKNFRGFLKNCIDVLVGRKTWFSYINSSGLRNDNLPKLKDGILTPIVISTEMNLSRNQIDKINVTYAKDYKISKDISLIIKYFDLLGKQ